MLNKLSVIAGTSSEELAKKIARKLKANIVMTQNATFQDGESKITLAGDLSNEKIVVVQSIYPPVDTNLVHALSLIARARRTARQVTAVIPYMGYARQDREFLPGEIVATRVLAKLFRGAGATEIIVVDMHSKIGLAHFGKRSREVTAVPELVKHFKKMRLENPLVVSPDQGGKERAEEFAKRSKLGCIALVKQRDRKTGTIQIKTEGVDGINGMDVILVDDMISTGGSIIKATEFLKKQGCGRVFVACTHGLLLNDAEKKIKKAGVTEIVSTNTIPGSTSSVDVSGVIARAIG